MWIYVPLSGFISFSICKLVTQPGVPLVGALVVWSLAIMGTRVFVTIVLLRDVVPMGTWVALGLMLLARFAQTYWR